MFEYHEGHDNSGMEHHALSDAEIPEPLENWSLDDFEELLPRG